MEESADFVAWYVSIVEPDLGEAWPVDEKRQREEFLRRWFLKFYDAHGPVPKEVVLAEFVVDQVRLAAENVAIVMPDIERSSGLRPIVAVDNYMSLVRISFNGGYTTPSVWAWENPEALVEVADYLQEQMMNDAGVWPSCPAHTQVLLPEVHGDAAVWWCRTGDHTVARIGDLGRRPEP
jgi:hypothetical protein